MIDKKIIFELTSDLLKEKEIFPVKIDVSKDNIIQIFLDGPHGILIDDCILVSRHIESQLNRETEDFELEVSSFGIGNPLLCSKQFSINVGRTAKTTLNDGKIITGTIIDANEESFSLEIQIKDKKIKNKKEILNIKYEDCRETIIIASFK